MASFGAPVRSRATAPIACSRFRGGVASLRTLPRCKADSHGVDTTGYWEAFVETVRLNEKIGPAIYLRLKDDGEGAVLPVYVGEPEGSALVKEINRRATARPMTHDLFKACFEQVGYKVVLVRIHLLVGNTYHARMHLQSRNGGPISDVDARPSDALNLALRFNAPIFVSKDIAAKMARPDITVVEPPTRQTETNIDIRKSCRDEMLLYKDPTVMLNLQLQLAIEEERYEEASGCEQLQFSFRNLIEKTISSDQSLRLVVAIETALADGRFEEAAKLRDELRLKRQVSSHQQQHDSQ